MKYNSRIIHLLCLVSALFLSLALYLTYFQVFRAEELANSGSNPRTVAKEQKIKRGDIYSSDGETLAYSEMSASTQKRVYPFKNMYAHVIGYNSSTYGRNMLENTFNSYIMGSGFSNEIYNLRQQLMGEGSEGANLTLTIDHSLQKKAYELLGDRSGAVAAINPKTGATLALVSKPDFDPNDEALLQSWQQLNESANSVFLPRATRGLYAPGSVFKAITAVGALENGLGSEVIDDTGSVVIDGHEFVNYNKRAYGELDLKTGFAKSSNVVFVSLADMLGYNKLLKTSKKFMIGEKVEYDISLETGQVLKEDRKTNVAAVGMGQGDLLVTPMNMALTAAALANDGTMMQPYLVESAEISNGYSVYSHKKSVLAEVTDRATARKMREMMIECVQTGTGTSAAVSGISVAGKTGTAENTGEDHAWFIAYAPADDPEIAICVMVENAANTGGQVCGPIIAALISHWCR